jgi:hypothetical protein
MFPMGLNMIIIQTITQYRRRAKLNHCTRIVSNARDLQYLPA